DRLVALFLRVGAGRAGGGRRWIVATREVFLVRADLGVHGQFGEVRLLPRRHFGYEPPMRPYDAVVAGSRRAENAPDCVTDPESVDATCTPAGAVPYGGVVLFRAAESTTRRKISYCI